MKYASRALASEFGRANAMANAIGRGDASVGLGAIGFDDDPDAMMGMGGMGGMGSMGFKPTLRRSFDKLTPAQQRIALAYGYKQSGLGLFAGKGKKDDGTRVDVGRVTRQNRAAKATEAAAIRQDILHTQYQVGRGQAVPDTPNLQRYVEKTGRAVVIPPSKKAPNAPAVVVAPKLAPNTPIVVNLPSAPPPIVQEMAAPSPIFDAPTPDAGYVDEYAGGEYAEPMIEESYEGDGGVYAGLGKLNFGKIFKKVTKAALPLAAAVGGAVLTGGASLGPTLISQGGQLVRSELSKAMAPKPAPVVVRRPVPRPAPKAFATVAARATGPVPAASTDLSKFALPALLALGVIVAMKK